MPRPCWVPRLNNRDLEPCALIEDLVSENNYPDPDSLQDEPWLVTALAPHLDKAPLIREELLESVVAIWRLREVDEQGPNDPIWQDHLEAWLVRPEHRISVGRSFNVAMRCRFAIATCALVPTFPPSRWLLITSSLSRAQMLFLNRGFRHSNRSSPLIQKHLPKPLQHAMMMSGRTMRPGKAKPGHLQPPPLSQILRTNRDRRHRLPPDSTTLRT